LREVTNVNTSEFVRWVVDQGPDLLFCAAYPQIFGAALLSAARLGGVNFHPSLLPRCRGANPVYWAIASGEKETGVSAHFMTQEVDAGDLVAQIAIPIAEEDDYWSLYSKALRETPRLVERVEAFFAEGRTAGIPQDAREATTFREPRQLDRRLFWASRPPARLVRQVRAGEAFIVARGQWIGVRHAELVQTVSHLTNGLQPPGGTVIKVGDGELVVAAEGGAVAIRQVAHGGRTMDGAALAARLGLHIGEILP
jgi:methionyl-tRNA formyltransferase